MLPRAAAAPAPPPSRRTVLRGALAASLALVAAGAVGCDRVVGGAVTAPVAPPGGRLRTALLQQQPFTVAHRGGSADWPEMSLAAYERSVALGVNALEMSLARSSDGVWFGLHDATLDAVTSTSGAASQRSWQEISRLQIRPPQGGDPDVGPQPFARFEDVADRWAATHTLFVDVKVVPQQHWSELFALMRRHAAQPAESFIAKGYGTGTGWARAARAEGLTSWGYYYGGDVDSGVLGRTASSWDLLGMDVAASDAQWATTLAQRKPVIGHILTRAEQVQRVRDAGGQGLMIGGVREVL